jgi:hypothetical protein
VAAIEQVLTIAARSEPRRCGSAARVVRPDESEHVDVQHPVPLLVRVVRHGAGGADARVVDQGVEAAERLGRRLDGRTDRPVVAHVGGEAGQGGRAVVAGRDHHRAQEVLVQVVDVLDHPVLGRPGQRDVSDSA